MRRVTFAVGPWSLAWSEAGWTRRRLFSLVFALAVEPRIRAGPSRLPVVRDITIPRSTVDTILAERQVTANLNRDVRAIVHALNQVHPRPADASMVAYLEGASTVTQLALTNELHQGNPVAVREIIQDIVRMYHGAPIVAGQGGDWHQQGVTVDQHDLEHKQSHVLSSKPCSASSGETSKSVSSASRQ